MSELKSRGRTVVVLGLVLASTLLASRSRALALNASLEISQYAHTSWTVRDGFSLGTIFAMAQTPDGYLWLGSEFGLFRFDGVHFRAWKPPAGQQLPSSPYSLLVTRDGTLWIGTFEGLVSWNGAELTGYPEIGDHFVTSLFEDREGTVWAGILGGSPGTPTGRLCAVRNGGVQIYGEDGAFGLFVWSLGEDSSGALWAGAESGLWRWSPGPPRQYAMPGMRISGLTLADDGRLLIGVDSGGLRQLVGDNVEPYPIRRAANPSVLLQEEDVDSNKLLRDRDGGLWIGTHQRGLIHIHNGRADVFTKSDGLSGDVSCSVFEDREGNIWYASTGGLDRFRERPVTTITSKQGLSSDAAESVIAAEDGSVWVATRDGVSRWKDGHFTVFRSANGLPGDFAQSLYEDHRGRVWVFTNHGLAYFENDRFVAVSGVPSTEVYSITGDEGGNLWLSGNQGLSHLLDTRLVEHFPWPALGRHQQAKVIVADQGGLWLSFWTDGGVLYFKDGQVRASYTPADGLGAGHVPGLELDRDGAVWAATEQGGLSRIKDGRITTLTTRNGLPCDTIHRTIEDDDRSLWMYTACGLVRVARSELDAWIADPTRKIEMTVWDTTDGVMLHPIAPSSFGPPVAKAADGKLWFRMGDGIQVVDPHHLVLNQLPPPVHIEQVTADGTTYDGSQGLRLPPRVRDLAIDYTALSLVAPEKVRFRFKLEGQDDDWREVVNDRHVQYSNLPPGSYRFRVMACNNSGVWNDVGDTLEFSIEPAFYQTNWFRFTCAVLSLAVLWAGYRFRIRQVRHQERRLRDVIEGVPTLVFAVRPDGSPDFVSQRWLDFAGLPADALADARSWEATIHPNDVEAHVDKWRAALASGEPFENEARHRSASGEYRWLQVRAVPFRDKTGEIVKWYGTLTDIEDRKRAERALERSEVYQAEAQRLTHTGSWAFNPATGEMVYWSEEVFRIHGLDPRRDSAPSAAELARRFVHPEDRDRVREALQTSYRTRADVDEEYRIVRPDGVLRHLHAIAHPVLDETGALVEYIGTAMDVTERKHAREALRESEERFRKMADTAPVMIWIAGVDKRFTYVNQQWIDFTGRSLSEGLGEGWAVGIHPDDNEDCLRTYNSAFDRREPFSVEYRLRRSDGEYRWIYGTGVPRLSSGKEFLGFIGSCVDITERRRAEEELRQAQAAQFEIRLESRVRERTRIARELHDTLLQSFQGLLLRFQSVLKLLPDRPLEARQRLESAIEQAAEAITNARDAIQGLRSVVMNGDLARTLTAVGEELADQQPDHDRPALRVEVEGTPRELNPAARDDVYRVAVEALRNAFHHAQARRIAVEIRYDERQFCLRVSDDGRGFDEEAAGRAAAAGHFGLHGMRERAERVGGRLEVGSRHDTGTRAELSIPGATAYGGPARRSWLSQVLSGKSANTGSTEP